jgi:hypothetical protein
MAKKRKTAKRAGARRATGGTRGRARKQGGMMDMMTPSGLMSNMSSLIGSQTGRVIMAEALVAAAGAAAAVLVASRTEQGEKAREALVRTGRDSAAVLKEAARSAATAAGEVIAAMATNALGNVAKQVLGGEARRSDDDMPTQHDLAKKAMNARERNQHH